jgi:hypothetical protein
MRSPPARQQKSSSGNRGQGRKQRAAVRSPLRSFRGRYQSLVASSADLRSFLSVANLTSDECDCQRAVSTRCSFQSRQPRCFLNMAKSTRSAAPRKRKLDVCVGSASKMREDPLNSSRYGETAVKSHGMAVGSKHVAPINRFKIHDLQDNYGRCGGTQLPSGKLTK